MGANGRSHFWAHLRPVPNPPAEKKDRQRMHVLGIPIAHGSIRTGT